jgi:amidase
VMAGPSALTPLRQPIEGRDFAGAVRAGPKRGLAVAYAADPSGIGIDAGIAAVCRAAADALSREGVRVDEVPFDLSDGRDAFTMLRGHWYASWMAERLDHVDDFGVNVQHSTRAGLAGKGEALGQAELVRGRIWHRMRTLLERYDHLITPTMAVPPFPVEENYPGTVAGKAMPTYVEWLAPTYVLSLTGLPVASAPCGLDAGGLPVGMQIVGRPTGEEAVLALAGMVQRVRPIGAPAMVAAG